LKAWNEDWTFEAKCDNGDDDDGDDEACTYGSACDSCNIWSAVNGVKYCCAKDCNSGSIDVSSVNGVVTCVCRHNQ
jgi:hypothetical protein